MRRPPIRAVLATAVVAGLGGAILWQTTDGFRAITTEGARRLRAIEAHIAVPAIPLTDMSGQAIALPNGKVNVVEFIYTSCPTICRAAGDDFARLRDRLRSAATPDQVQMLSISFDPARDGQDQLQSYAETHGAEGRMWTIARPSIGALPALLDSFGVTVIPDEFGGFQHNIAAHVIDASGRLVRILDTDDIERTAQTVEALLDDR